jgi:hypothetical protein
VKAVVGGGGAWGTSFAGLLGTRDDDVTLARRWLRSREDARLTNKMRVMSLRTGSLALVLAVVLAGCGGGGGSSSSSSSGGGDASAVAPADTLVFATLDTDRGSSQITSAETLLDKFPIKAKLLSSVRQSIAKEGVDLKALEGSVGPEVDVAVLKVNGKTTTVGFTQPKDKQTFERQLTSGKNPLKYEEVSGWTIFCDEQAALDAVKQRSGDLADEQAYKDAIGTLPDAGDALARVFVAPGGLGEAVSAIVQQTSTIAPSGTSAELQKVKWVAAAATAHDDGVELEAHAKMAGAAAKSFAKSPADVIPSGALAALAFNGSSSTTASSASKSALQQLNQTLGVNLSPLLDAFSGETLLYVRPGVPIPEVTLLASGGDPKQEESSVAALIHRFAQSSAPAAPTTVDSVTLQRVALGSIDLFYGIFDGKLLVSDSERSVSELKSSGDKLADDGVFKSAKDAAAMPDSTQGWLYVNLQDSIPAIEGLAALANSRIPPNVDANLRPLKSFLLYGDADGGVQNLVAFLQTG